MWTALLGIGKSMLSGWQERKAKAADAKQAWETAMGQSMSGSWKDEYVTIVVTWPILQMFIGNLVFAFNEDARIMLDNQKSLEDLGALMDTPYGQLMMVVVLAAVGIKGLKILK